MLFSQECLKWSRVFFSSNQIIFIIVKIKFLRIWMYFKLRQNSTWWINTKDSFILIIKIFLSRVVRELVFTNSSWFFLCVIIWWRTFENSVLDFNGSCPKRAFRLSVAPPYGRKRNYSRKKCPIPWYVTQLHLKHSYQKLYFLSSVVCWRKNKMYDKSLEYFQKHFPSHESQLFFVQSTKWREWY